MSENKKFLFFKMYGCGPCQNFEEGPWRQLINDKDLKHIEFEKYEWGKKRDVNGNIAFYRLPQQYSFVTYGPYICLQSKKDPKDIVTYDPRKKRTLTALKKWILENSGKNNHNFRSLYSNKKPKNNEFLLF